MTRQSPSLLSALILLAVSLAACQPMPPAAPTLDQDLIMTQAVATAMAQYATPIPPTFTITPEPSATAVRTPPVLPVTFQTDLLKPGDLPRTYVADSCQYLKDKWTSTNAAPGTVVMVVMIHTIEKGVQTSTEYNHIGGGDFKNLMKGMHEFGFTAINMQQLENFLYSNSKIPQRSVVIIQDDRKSGENFNDWFRPYWEQWSWPVVNAWINQPNYLDPNWADNSALEQEGWVDHQAHGVIHNTPMSDSSTDEYLHSELQGSIDGIQTYYGKNPIAIIWPGGGFGIRSVKLARELGYKLGFTVNPRGPVMYNWVPQVDQPYGQYDIAEGPIGDPLMTLPRYYDIDVLNHIDTVMQIGEQATAYAQQNKATELEYYDIVCAPTYGPIP